MFKENYFNAKIKMKNNVLKSFLVYLSDYLSFLLFLMTTFFVLYFLIYDTSFASSLGIFDSDIVLGTVCAAASVESVALFILFFYVKLKKKAYFIGERNMTFSFHSVIKYMNIELVTAIRRIISFFIFMSPFLLSVSALFLLVDTGVSQKVFVLSCVGASILFVSGFVSYLVYICKFAILTQLFIYNTELSMRQIFRLASSETDGKMLLFFRLKCKNLPRRIISLTVFPSIYYLPFCLFTEYDFLGANKKPYSHEVNTEKSVVFYFNPVKEN